MEMMKSKLNREQIIDILKASGQSEMKEIFAEARQCRNQYTRDTIFAYGFVYFSTWCWNDCAFCFYRQSNNINRYRKTKEEIYSIVDRLAKSGVSLVDLTMGEDPEYFNNDFINLIDVVKNIKNSTDLSVMISPGVIDNVTIDRFADIGTDWYALYQETHNQELFEKLRLGQSYAKRIEAKKYAKEKGMLIEEGIMTGVGESIYDIADSILAMGDIGAKQMRVMSFVPQKGSPMENQQTPERTLELKTIAAMRIAYPNALIPASLDVDGISGLKARIDAGSNVVTSIIPPGTGLSGVAHEKMDVDDGSRTVEEVDHVLQKMGLEVGTPQEYKQYIGDLRCAQ